MESYERTMQLIETAQDSAGRSSEQFAKYADSVENKVNKLKNTWEQFRINLVDEKMYKSLLDFANNFLKKFTKVKLPQIAGIAVWGMTIGNQLIQGIIKGLRQGSNLISGAIENITTTVKSGSTKIELQTNLRQLQEEAEQLRIKFQELVDSGKTFRVDLLPSSAQGPINALERALNSFNLTVNATNTSVKFLDFTTEEYKNTLDQLKQSHKITEENYDTIVHAIGRYRQELTLANQGLAEYRGQLDRTDSSIQKVSKDLTAAKNLGVLGNAIGSAIGTAAMMAFTGTFSGEQIAKSISIQLLSSGAMTVINATTAAVGRQAGTTFGEAFTESSGWIGLLLTSLSMLALAVSPLIKDLAHDWKMHNDEVYQAQQKYKDLVEQSEKLSEKLDEQNKKLEELNNKWNNVSDAKATFEELSQKIDLTEEEQQDLNEATKTLAETMPQLVQHYDAQGNAVIEINEHYKEQIKLLKQEILEQEKLTALTNAQLQNNKYSELILGKNTVEAILEKDDVRYQSDDFEFPIVRMSIKEMLQNIETLDLNKIYWDSKYSTEINEAMAEAASLVTHQMVDATTLSDEKWASYTNEQRKAIGDLFLEKFLPKIMGDYTFDEQSMNAYLGFDKDSQEIAKANVEAFRTSYNNAIETALLNVDESKRQDMIKSLLSNIYLNDEDINKAYEQERDKYEDGIIPTETIPDLISNYINQDDIDKVINDIETMTPQLYQSLSKFYDQLKALTKEERAEIIQAVKDSGVDEIAQNMEEQEKAIQENINKNREKYLTQRGYKDWYYEDRGSYKELVRGTVPAQLDSAIFALSKGSEAIFNKVLDNAREMGGKAGDEYIIGFNEVAEKYNLNEEARGFLADYDWSQMDWIHLHTQVRSLAAEFVTKGWASELKEAEQLIKDFIKDQQQSLGIITEFTTVGDVESLIEKVNSAFEILQGEMDNFTPVFRVGLEADVAKLTQDEYDKFAKAIKTITSKKGSPWAGLIDIKDYTAYDKNGKVYLTNLKELKDILFKEDGPIAGIKQLQNAYKELEALGSNRTYEQNAMFQALGTAIDQLEDIDKYEKQFTENAKKAVTTFRDIEKSISSIVSDYQSIVDEQADKGFLSSKSLEGFLSSIDELNEQLEETSLINKRLDVSSILTRNEKGYVISTAALRNYITELIKATMVTDGLSEEDEHLHERLQAILDDLNAFEAERLKKAQEEALEAAKKKEEELQKAAEDAQKAMEDAQKDAEDAKKNAEEAQEKIKEAEDALAEAQKKVQDGYKDIEEKQKKVIELQDQLNELLYGTGDRRKSSLDGLYNYEQRLQALNNSLEDTKKNLEDIDNSNLSGTVYTYGTLMHNRKATLLSEQSVYSNNLAAIKSEISPYTEYFTEVNGRLLADVAKINAAQMNDKYKEWLESQISAYNDSVDKIHDIKNELISIEDEFKNFQKTYRDKYINLQESVINTLKEQAQEEVNITKEKYAAMEEADNDYISALEQAIQKQRELRQLEQERDDLAQKEKKLSLLKRDTSGTRQKDVLKQQKDVEKARQGTVDKSVDNLIKNLKELYKNQKEARDAEVKYQEEVLKNATYIEEANAIIKSWGTADEMIGWFMEHNQKTQEMTAEQLEKYSEELQEMYNAREIYMTTSMKDFSNMLNVQQQEINDITTETAEHLTSEAHRSFEEIKKEVDEAIEKARQDLADAMNALREAKDELVGLLNDVKLKLDAVTEANNNAAKSARDAAEANQAYADSVKLAKDAEDAYKAAAKESENLENNPKTTVPDTGGNGNYNYTPQPSPTPAKPDIPKVDTPSSKPADTPTTTSPKEEDSDAKKKREAEEKRREHEKKVSEYIKGKIAKGYTVFELSNELKNDYDAELAQSWLENNKYHAAYNKKTYTFYLKNSYADASSYITSQPAKERGNYVAFAKGGLVNYTGPAWVDGTPAQPEAFLSAEDTRNITHFTDVLSSLYNSFGQFNPSVSSTRETIINVTVNVDGVSSDYDVDQAVERVKQSIIDAANQTGSTVILHQ